MVGRVDWQRSELRGNFGSHERDAGANPNDDVHHRLAPDVEVSAGTEGSSDCGVPSPEEGPELEGIKPLEMAGFVEEFLHPVQQVVDVEACPEPQDEDLPAVS